jgi:hypothetical protein
VEDAVSPNFGCGLGVPKSWHHVDVTFLIRFSVNFVSSSGQISNSFRFSSVCVKNEAVLFHSMSARMDIARAELGPLVVKFYRQYMQQINDVTYPSGALLVNPDVQECLYRYFFDASRNKYLPPPKYQSRILKHIISEIEKACKNPEEDVGPLQLAHL